MISAPTDSGFSLIEMLVAMAILAMTATALLEGQAGSLRAAHIMQEKTLAGIVADSRLALALGTTKLPAAGMQTGQIKSLQQDFRWQEEVRLISGQDMLTVTVTVLDTDGNTLTQRTAYRRVE